MSTSPDRVGPVVVPASDEVAPAVFSPIPQLIADGGLPAPRRAPSTAAAGYAAGWAQGVAAAAANERTAAERAAAEVAAERERLRRQADHLMSALDEAAAAMRQRVAPAVDETADVLASAAVDLAEAVLGTEITDAEGRGRSALSRALAHAPEHEEVVVRLNPADLAALSVLLGDDADTALASGGGATDGLSVRPGIELVADSSIEGGDAIADFPGGSVDARVATALSRMRGTLRVGWRA